MVLFVLSTSSGVKAGSLKDQPALTAATLNFARLTHWPTVDIKTNAATFNLCVIGTNVVQQSFTNINHDIVNHKMIRVLNRSYLQDLSECHLVYISGLKRTVLIQVLLKLKNKPVLTIGEGFAFIQVGGMVGLELVQDEMQLNINLVTINQASLVVSSRLLKLGKIFSFPYLRAK
ncbi:MAG: hypothetical protein methR_P3738 [Methyloprofundus sp.]|nr:MAG: hypothetical protein methR_P3738 [Methyloprofundus sp.]